MKKIKALLLVIWEEKYLFATCIILAFFGWQVINNNINVLKSSSPILEKNELEIKNLPVG